MTQWKAVTCSCKSTCFLLSSFFKIRSFDKWSGSGKSCWAGENCENESWVSGDCRWSRARQRKQDPSVFLLPESFVRSIGNSGCSSAQNLSLTFLDDVLWNQNASLLRTCWKSDWCWLMLPTIFIAKKEILLKQQFLLKFVCWHQPCEIRPFTSFHSQSFRPLGQAASTTHLKTTPRRTATPPRARTPPSAKKASNGGTRGDEWRRRWPIPGSLANWYTVSMCKWFGDWQEIQ